ncbi:MAG: hypothetical protein D6752_00925 [Candidatus Nitrosothermus koennekii]|nr:MAG: hypothetical protein D6752_00925 [Candidatus Nitrosothermus koennekii]
MMQVTKRDTLIISLALGVMIVFLLGSIIRINGFVIPHTILHTIGLILSGFLIVVSVAAYRRVKISRFMLLAFGFMGFVIMESINLVYAWLQLDISELSVLNMELPHIFGVYILMLLVIATLRGVN